MSNSNYDHYENLCGGLERWATEFEAALDRFGPVHHRLIRSNEAVSAVGWHNFAERYGKSAANDGERWEEWRPHPDGMACSYFYGRGSRTNLDEFTRLADSGYTLLLELQKLQAEDSIPSDADIYLPEEYRGSTWDLSNRYFDWLLVLHDTAMGCHTVRLRDRVEFWEYSQDNSLSDVEQATIIEQLEEMWSDSGPDRFPLHPMTESLHHDLFISSAEAIRIWLDPWDDEIVPVGKGIEESPVYLPEANSVVEDDAPVLPTPAESPIHLPEANSVNEDDNAPEPQSSASLKPNWDAGKRELKVGQKLIKVFNQAGKKQVAILEAFEKQNWPTKPVDNPLEFKEQGPSEFKTLSDTVHDLNKHHRTKDVLRFHARRGAVWWELAPFSGKQ